MGGTLYEFENVEELKKSIPFLSEYFRKNYNESVAERKKVPKEYIGKLIEGWSGNSYIFYVNAESYFSPFWVEKNGEYIDGVSNKKLKAHLLLIKDGYADDMEIMEYLIDKGIKFTKGSIEHLMNWKGRIRGFRCMRCKHSWKPRKYGIPKVCPRCKSPYWNRKKTTPTSP